MTHKSSKLKIFSGNANPELAQSISQHLGLPLGRATVDKFSNGETHVQIEENVRDCDAYIIQSTCNPTPNDYLMELIIMADAMKRASCKRITAVIPCFGYAKQDKKEKPRDAITGKLVANLIKTSGVDRIMTMDLHASQIQGFFDIPVDNLFAERLIAKHIKKSILGSKVIVSPNAGGVKRAKSLADLLECDLAILHKKKIIASNSQSGEMLLVGDVTDKVCVILSDIADTCATITIASSTLLEYGAKEVHACVTHGVLSGNAIERIANSPIKSLVVTNSIPQSRNSHRLNNLHVIDIGGVLSEAIRRTHNSESISVLFNI
jgi:ribose-phosphate pyrophosphokinase